MHDPVISEIMGLFMIASHHVFILIGAPMAFQPEWPTVM